MKVRPSFRKTIIMLLIIILIGAGIVFSFTFSFFLKPIQNWGWEPYTIIGIWLAFSIALVILSFFFYHYEVYKKYVTVVRLNKKLIYYYSDVVYIDESQYEKSKTIAFFTRQGHSRYLVGDKKDILYNTMLANCTNRIDSEEFRRKYPQVKL